MSALKSMLIFLCFTFVCSSYGAEYIIFGDAGQLRPELNDLNASVSKEKTRSVILLGDQIYDVRNSYAKLWDDFKSAGFSFDVVALGNHHRSYKEEIEYFKIPGEYYSKEYADEIFIVLNSDNTKNVIAQMRFLYDELEKYKESKKLLFIVFHHPLGTISEFHDWGERWLFQLCFPLTIWQFKHRIAAILVGHDHFSGFYNVDGLPMILAGGAVDLRSGKYNYSRRISAEYVNDTNRMWVKLITSSAKAEFHFVDVKTRQVLFKREVVKK